jgi:hypothetical protein
VHDESNHTADLACGLRTLFVRRVVYHRHNQRIVEPL